jgi:phosphoadenosine phosphosulfate reductase
MAALTDAVIVFYSGGKDSAVALDLAVRRFKTVHVVFMYQVQGLSFQEASMRWAEKKYGIEVYRIPHFELSTMLRRGIFCKPDPSVRPLTISNVYDHVRRVFGCRWIVAGERCADSTVRNAMIKASGPIDEKRGRFYPLAFWTKKQTLSYIEAHKLKISPESALLGHSFRSFDGKDLRLIRESYPADYDRVIAAFPLAEVALVREGRRGEDRA